MPKRTAMRIEAEARLEQVPDDLAELPPQQIRSMLQDLRVHQVELEMQNEELRQTQAQLAAAQALYFDLYDLAPAGYVTINELGLMLEVNLTASTMLGVTRGTLAGCMFSGSVCKEDQDTYFLFHRYLFDSGVTQSCELRMIKKDGLIVWTHLEGTSGTSPDGQHVGRIVLSDISVRKLAEARIARVSMLYAALSDCSHSIVHSKSVAELLSEICRNVVERGGLKMAWIGTPDPQSGRIFPAASYGNGLEYLSQLESSINPDEPSGSGGAATAFREGIAVWCDDYQNDPNQASWSGVNRRYEWGAAAAIPLLMRGKAAAVLLIYSDTAWAFDEEIRELLVEMADNVGHALEHFAGEDERKQTLVELLVLRTAIEQAAGVFIITDPAGTIEYVNPAFEKATGYTSAEVLGQNPRILSSGEQGHLFYRQLWSSITSGTVWRGEFHNRRKDGSLFWELATISPVINDSRQVVHFVAIKDDVTERKLMEEELRQAKQLAERANALKSLFLANMSHEIRTSMNGIMGMAEQLLENDLDPAQRERAEIVLLSAEGLLSIINDILDISKIEAGMLALESLEFDPVDVLDNLARLLTPQASKKDLAFTCDAAQDVPRAVVGDPGRLRQILLNLASNAIKFTHHGTVSVRMTLVSASPTTSILRFAVCDTGIGILADKLELLFKKFTQVDSSTAREYGGTGLGLAISKQLVALMGGEIGVSSVINEGSEFWFTVCFSTSRHSAPVPASTPPPPAAYLSWDGMRILLVDDEPINQKVAMGYLRLFNLQVDVVDDGEAAIQALGEHPYDLVFMDMQMPRLDGVEATRLIRSRHSVALNPHVPIIAMTANVMQGDRQMCLEAGMNDHVAKPFNRRMLVSVLEKWLPKSPLPPSSI